MMTNHKSALIIKQPHIGNILNGNKKWEIRGSKTHKRGLIGLIQSGSGLIIGECELVDCIGQLTQQEYSSNTHNHLSGNTTLPYDKTYAWVMNKPRAYNKPIPYTHPKGAIIWVKV